MSKKKSKHCWNIKTKNPRHQIKKKITFFEKLCGNVYSIVFKNFIKIY